MGKSFPVFGNDQGDFAGVLRVSATGNTVFTRLITHRECQ